MDTFGKEYHLRMIAESVSQSSIKLNTVSDDVLKCYEKIVMFMLFHLKQIPKRLCCYKLRA